MNVEHYIGLDVHKKSVSYCVKIADGTRRALDGSGPFGCSSCCDGRLRRENHNTRLCKPLRWFASDPPAVPRVNGSAPRRLSLPMCHAGCFEAGRFTQIQSSWTALCCSRKSMSGSADTWAQSITDRTEAVVATRPPSALQEFLPSSAGRGVSTLDTSLSCPTKIRRSSWFVIVVLTTPKSELFGVMLGVSKLGWFMTPSASPRSCSLNFSANWNVLNKERSAMLIPSPRTAEILDGKYWI
jgi:hypothetical protein